MKLDLIAIYFYIIAGILFTHIAIGGLGTFGIFLMLWGNNLDLTRKKLLETSDEESE